jgi:hypothetical protein
MATVLFVVKATIPVRRRLVQPLVQLQAMPAVPPLSRGGERPRSKAILGEDKFRDMAVHEVQDEKMFRALMKSSHMKALRRDDDRWFGKVSERARFAYTQEWP